MKESVWVTETMLPRFNKLQGDKHTDVLIIGGGICGILIAYFLKEANIDYILVEGNRIASGITKNTTAKITALHGLIYDKLIKKLGKEKALLYLKANNDAINEYERICKPINCDFEFKPAYTYSLTSQVSIEKEVAAVKSLGFHASFCKETELPFKIKGAIRFDNQAQFNPLKFIRGISKDLNIYENTFISKINSNLAIYDGGKINAKKIIVATHFPFINKHGLYFLKLYQHRSYVSAYENAAILNGMYVDENMNGMSFSSYDNLLLIGGGSHRTGKKGGAWQEINRFAKSYYPNADLKFEWATQDCMSLDSLPYIGHYSWSTHDLYVATGFNKWGMTGSMVSAKILCNMIQGKKNGYAEVYSPHRSMITPQLLVNGFEAATNLLFPTLKRCSHLGCALKWNKYERSWDCPCHGSRFEKYGKLIDNPAKKDASI